MRVSLLASVIAHIAILLGALVSWGSPRTHDWRPPSVEVDLVPSQEAPKAPDLKGAMQEAAKQEPPKQEPSSQEPSKQEPAQQDQVSQPPPAQPPQAVARQEPPPRVPPSQRDDAPVAPPKPLTASGGQQQTPETKTQKDAMLEQAETAARLAETLNLSPQGTISGSAATPSDSKTNLTPEEIAELKARISKCWVAPPPAAGAERTQVIIRVALNPSGALAAEPQLIQAPAVPAGPLVMRNAIRAVQQCQPYNFLPRDKYKEWRVLDLSFTPSGVS